MGISAKIKGITIENAVPIDLIIVIIPFFLNERLE